jgi:thioredoxin 1
MANAIEVNEANFQAEVLKSPIPVLVDFWAVWCGPCKAVAPVVEELAKENAGKLKVVKVDVDQNQSLAMNYRVMSIPTLLVFKNGAVVNQAIGALPKAELQKLVDKAF